MLPFFSECNCDRIGQNIQNEVLLKRSIFEEVNVYQYLFNIFLDKSGRLKERCVTRKKLEQYLSLKQIEFRETSIFHIHHLKGFWEMIYFLRNITTTICTYSEHTDQQHLRVEFKQS